MDYEAEDKAIYRRLAEEAAARIDLRYNQVTGFSTPAGDYTEMDCDIVLSYLDSLPNGHRKATLIAATENARHLLSAQSQPTRRKDAPRSER